MKHQIDILSTTHNGARTLPRMLEASSGLSAPGRPFRILAVNNGSSDDTGSILAERAARLPLVLLQCAEPGKAPAQAWVLPHLEGDLIAIADDDIIPETDWLRSLERAADETPEACFFGGAITPLAIDPVGPGIPPLRVSKATCLPTRYIRAGSFPGRTRSSART